MKMITFEKLHKIYERNKSNKKDAGIIHIRGR